MSKKESPIIFRENSYESMRITADGHTWLLCEHGWKYCTTCDGWPCGEPKKVKTYCVECTDKSGLQFKPVKGMNANIAHYYGIFITGNVLVPPGEVEMPCGFTVSSPPGGWPRRDIPCPCGDSKHTVIAFR